MKYFIYGKLRECETAQCLLCSRNFIRPIGRTWLKQYCSRDCVNKSKVTQVHLECHVCKTEFFMKRSRLKRSKSGLYFCSKKCKDHAQSLEGGVTQIQPPHYGHGQSSYREIAYRYYPKVCDRCGYAEHIEILEVHHIDGNRKNNKKENLRVLCPNCHRLYTKKIVE